MNPDTHDPDALDTLIRALGAYLQANATKYMTLAEDAIYNHARALWIEAMTYRRKQREAEKP